MQEFRHDRIIRLLGVTFDEKSGAPYLILPYMQNGSLLKYIRREENILNNRQLTEFCKQIAEGMKYLSSFRMVHGDLAARNCLLDNDLNIKITDFGLTKDVYSSDYTSCGNRPIPFMYMAPECNRHGTYSVHTDVWSYGITMWEIFSRGLEPYTFQITVVDKKSLDEFLFNRNRLEKPPNCPRQIYQIMLSCWQWNRHLRPTFSQLNSSLQELDAHQLDEPEEINVNSSGYICR